MTQITPDLSKPARLRLDAESRLQQGTAPPTHGWSLSSNALATLYKLASTPDSAAEGLRLLHELQTHQVELDLQYEQLIANEHESAQDLAHYKELYDGAPVGYLVVGQDRRVIESNRAGAQLLATAPHVMVGNPFDNVVATGDRPALNNMMKELNADGANSFCVVHSPAADLDGARIPRKLLISASISPGTERFLIIVSECE